MSEKPTKRDKKEDKSQDLLAERFHFPDGPSGILSDSDRRFLLRDDPAFPDLEWEGDETQKRWRIREKVKTALHDFQLLNQLDQKDQKLIVDDVLDNPVSEWLENFNKPRAPYLIGPKQQMSHYSPSALGEQYQHLQEVVIFLYTVCALIPGPSFEDLIEDSIQRHIMDNSSAPDSGEIINANVNVTVDKEVVWDDLPDIEDLEAKLERGEGLTLEEIGELFIQGHIESGDVSAGDVIR